MATIANTLYMRESRAATALGEKTRPESRLHLSYVGAFLFPLSLFLFAGTASEPSELDRFFPFLISFRY